MGRCRSPCDQIHSRKRGTSQHMTTDIQSAYTVQVLRLTNPLSTSVASITIFGSQLLALTSDGSRLLTWDTITAGMLDIIQKRG